MFCFVLSQGMSRTESSVAKVTWDTDPLQMVYFNVIFYSTSLALFSTHFANVCLALPKAQLFGHLVLGEFRNTQAKATTQNNPSPHPALNKLVQGNQKDLP